MLRRATRATRATRAVVARAGRGLLDTIEWLRETWQERPERSRHVLNDRVAGHLIRSETVLVATRRHALVAVWPIPVSLTVVVMVGVLAGQLPAGSPVVDLLWWLWFATVFYAGWRLLEWTNDIFVVTDRRVMLFTGFLTRRIAMMPLVKVTDLTYQRTPLGRLLRYGDFIIESAGQDQALHTIRFLPRPMELYQQVAATLFGRADEDGDDVYDEDLEATGLLDRVED